MLRVVIVAIPVLAVTAGLYLVAVPQPPLDASRPVAPDASLSAIEAPDAPPLAEARVPYPPRNVTPPSIYSGPIRSFETPQSAEPAQPEQSAPASRRTFHRVVVASAGRLQAGDAQLRLDGIVAPQPNDTCTDEGGSQWPCGRAAMAALRLFVRHRAVECELGAATDEGRLASCAVAGRDLASWLIEQGWAEPADDTRFQSEFEAARAAGRGMFAAGHDAPPPVSVPVPATATTPAAR